MAEIAVILISLLIVILVVLAVFWLIKKSIVLAINSIIGIFALFGFNALFAANITINFWSVIFVAIGGLIGFIAVLVLHFTGLAF